MERGEANPRPNSVRYNDWRQVDMGPPETFAPAMPVSVIVPCWRTPAETLAMTLAALEGQTYPRDMFEVVLVDDGSDPPLALPGSTPLDVRVVRQERRGFGLARARNAGARVAAHDILLFLDSDLLAEADWMAAHARWHHVLSDVLTMGSLAHVPVGGLDAETVRRRKGPLRELFEGRPEANPGLEGHLIETGDLTSRADDPFRTTPGGNLGVGKDFYRSLGGNDESFSRWGYEDTEFGYRAYVRGGLLVPVRDAFAWHQGSWGDGRDDKERSARLQRGKAANLIAHPGFRRIRSGRTFQVPEYVVTVDGRRGSTDRLVETVANVLADRIRDLAVRIETGEGPDDERSERLRDEFGPDPRVRIRPARSALDEFPASPFHIGIPPAAFARNLTPRLRAALGDAAGAVATLPDGTQASIVRAWALNRARRTGKSPADFGEFRTISARALKPGRDVGRARVGEGGVEPADYPTARDRLFERMRDVRSFGDARSFLEWLVGVARFKTANMLRTAEWRRNIRTNASLDE